MAKRTQAIGKSTGKNKTKMGVIDSRRARQIVRKNGFSYEYSIGDHYHYAKDGKKIVIGHHLNRMVWERTVKENNLNLNV